MELQELIIRGRLVLSSAPGRQEIFQLVNGRNTAKQISKKINKRITNTLRDLQKLRDVGLIEIRLDKFGKPLRPDGSVLYQKVPVVRHVSIKYFITPIIKNIATKPRKGIGIKARIRTQRKTWLPTPSDVQIIDACQRGEDQIYEFKAAGTETRALTKEISAFLHTKQGGMILLGVEDDGHIAGAGMSCQKFDQAIQNSVRSLITPAPNIRVHSVKVLGTEVLVVITPPWNRRDIYYYEGRVYVRRGTNAFPARPEEIKRLHKGEFIV